jgi:hypothetical protein
MEKLERLRRWLWQKPAEGDSSIKIQRLSADKATFKIRTMKITRNIGMFLLGIYLIVDGLLGFGLNLGPAIFLLYLIALAAGIFILIGK